LVELAAGGNNGMRNILHNAGQELGIAIANLITLFAPPKVILAGSALQAGELLLGPLHDAVRSATPKALADVTEFVVHDPGDDMWARGAAALALRDLYGSPWTKTGSA
jgi:predicted NBD/HSP70 family sugar kinase